MRTNALPANPSLAAQQVIKAFDNWSRASGAEVTSIMPQWKNDSTNYMTFNCHVEASGTMGTLSQFLYQIEKGPMALKLDSVELSAHDEYRPTTHARPANQRAGALLLQKIMKTTRYLNGSVLALALANGWSATRATEPHARTRRCPGRTITTSSPSSSPQRNIFDPQRYAIMSGSRLPARQRTPRYAPTFTLVGTMSYEKGMFAFFDGNQSDLRKVLYQSDSNGIAGYHLAEITLASVNLQAADKKQTVQMKIGDAMQQEGSIWQLARPGRIFSRRREQRFRQLGAGNDFDSTSSAAKARHRRRTAPARKPAPRPARPLKETTF